MLVFVTPFLILAEYVLLHIASIYFISGIKQIPKTYTAWKVSKYGPNAGKYGPEKTPYLDTFHAVLLELNPYNVTGLVLYPVKTPGDVFWCFQGGIERDQWYDIGELLKHDVYEISQIMLSSKSDWM